MKKFMAVVAALMFLLSGCSNSDNSYDYSDNNPYSRKRVNRLSQSVLFGTQRSDDETLALKYLYDSKEISDIYGDTFQFTLDDDDENFIICHKSETKSFFFLWLFKGEAMYEFVIDGMSYKVSLTKSYFGKWEVTGWEVTEYQLDDYQDDYQDDYTEED